MRNQPTMNSGNADGQFATNTNPFLEHFVPSRVAHGPAQDSAHRTLRVMKFGGTSLGDDGCIRKVVEIIRNASAEGDVAVVVSAMSGVTNQLLKAATEAAAKNLSKAAGILKELRQKHYTAAQALIDSDPERARVGRKMRELFAECEQLCESVARRGELTLPLRDSISSFGERLSAPLVTAALTARGVVSEAVEATELVVTDAYHGAADPNMDLTRARSEARLRPLLKQGIIPIMTGFIGATENGVLTTLGRGGSDYSATILGAALGAEEVTIWTDVDGMLTADPHLVPGATTIPEISYREAAELAYYGANVLHPKTLRPVMQCGIPVWIRNTFAPERAGTKISPPGHATSRGVKALAAVSDAALITVGGPAGSHANDVARRSLAAAAAVRADVLLISHAPSRNHLYLVVAGASAQRTVEALRREFAADSNHESVHHITADSTVAILTVVGQNQRDEKGIVGRVRDKLSRENVDIVATGQVSSECNVSFVVARKDVKTALVTTHREFQLSTLNLPQEDRREAQLL
jgi:bifunctional aspartokinase / homoserine dehydrogenase 1